MRGVEEETLDTWALGLTLEDIFGGKYGNLQDLFDSFSY